jgi:hypothetical protein
MTVMMPERSGDDAAGDVEGLVQADEDQLVLVRAVWSARPVPGKLLSLSTAIVLRSHRMTALNLAVGPAPLSRLSGGRPPGGGRGPHT